MNVTYEEHRQSSYQEFRGENFNSKDYFKIHGGNGKRFHKYYFEVKNES